jgi:hypothetical protein
MLRVVSAQVWGDVEGALLRCGVRLADSTGRTQLRQPGFGSSRPCLAPVGHVEGSCPSVRCEPATEGLTR